MKKVYHAVPREDGGWKILVQMLPQAEKAEDELNAGRPSGGTRTAVVPESIKLLPDAPPSEA